MYFIKWNNRCGSKFASFTVALSFFYFLQLSATQLFWIWSVPGLSLDTAATILSPQRDPEACQSYKLGFREGSRRPSAGEGNCEWNSRREWYQLKLTPTLILFFLIQYHCLRASAFRLGMSLKLDSREHLWSATCDFDFRAIMNTLSSDSSACIFRASAALRAVPSLFAASS